MIDINKLAELRQKLDTVFQKDTAHPACRNNPMPSAGHCALVSVVLQDQFGAEIVSTYMRHIDTNDEPSSHWLNYLDGWFIDLTGDQFGYAPVRIFKDDIENYRVRRIQHLDEDAIARLKKFLSRLGDEQDR